MVPMNTIMHTHVNTGRHSPNTYERYELDAGFLG